MARVQDLDYECHKMRKFMLVAQESYNILYYKFKEERKKLQRRRQRTRKLRAFEYR